MSTYDNDFKWYIGGINMYGCSNTLLLPGIVKVIFNDPATIVIWEDGSKTVVKCDCESFDPEKGLAMAIAKKALGNRGNYYETFKTWLPEQPKAVDILKDMYRLKKGNKAEEANDIANQAIFDIDAINGIITSPVTDATVPTRTSTNKYLWNYETVDTTKKRRR